MSYYGPSPPELRRARLCHCQRPVCAGRAADTRLADDLTDGRPAAAGPTPAICGDLLELLAGVTDGRLGQGRDHPVAAVLALAASG